MPGPQPRFGKGSYITTCSKLVFWVVTITQKYAIASGSSICSFITVLRRLQIVPHVHKSTLAWTFYLPWLEQHTILSQSPIFDMKLQYGEALQRGIYNVALYWKRAVRIMQNLINWEQWLNCVYLLNPIFLVETFILFRKSQKSG